MLPVPVKHDELAISELVKLLESHPPTIRSFREGNLFGMFVGALALLGGFVSSLLGLTGSVEWFLTYESISMKLLNASPGAIFSVIGFIIMLRYKPRVKTEIEIKINESQNSKDASAHTKEISVRHSSTASSPISSSPPSSFYVNRFPWRYIA